MNYFKSEYATAAEEGTQHIERILMLCRVILEQRGIKNKGISVYELTSLIEVEYPSVPVELSDAIIDLFDAIGVDFISIETIYQTRTAFLEKLFQESMLSFYLEQAELAG